MLRILKLLFYSFLALILAGGAMAVYLFFFFSPNEYRDEIAKIIKDRSGLEVEFAEYLNWTLYPVFGLEMKGLAVGAGGPGEGKILEIGTAKLGIEILPLFYGKVSVEQVVIDRAKLTLTTNADGKNNWDFLMPAEAENAAGQAAAAEKETAAGGASGESETLGIKISEIKITGGEVDYRNDLAGVRITLADLRLSTEDFALNQNSFASFGFDSALELLKSGEIHSMSGEGESRFNLDGEGKSLTVDTFDGRFLLDSPFFSRPGVSLNLESSFFAEIEKENFDLRFLEITLAEVLSLRLKSKVSGFSADLIANSNLNFEVMDLKRLLKELGEETAGLIPGRIRELAEQKVYSAEMDVVSQISLAAEELTLSKLNLNVNRLVFLESNLFLKNFNENAEIFLNATARSKNLLGLYNGLAPILLKKVPLDAKLKSKITLASRRLDIFDFSVSTEATRLKLSEAHLSLGEKQISASGALDFKTGLAGRMLKKLKPELLNPENPNALSLIELKLDAKTNGDKILLPNVGLRVDDTRMKGSLLYDTASRAAAIRITGDRLNLDDYLPPPKDVDEKPGDESAGKDRIEYPSEPLIPWDLLKKATVDARIGFGAITVRKIPVAELNLNWVSNARFAELENFTAKILKGEVKARAKADYVAEGSEEVSLSLGVKNLPSAKILKSLLDFDQVDGRANLNADLAVRGNSVASFAESLSGAVGFELREGFIKSVNAGKYVCQGIAWVNRGEIDESVYPGRTDFEKLSGELDLKNGESDNLSLVATLAGFKATGGGSFSLPAQEFDARLALSVQGGNSDPSCRVRPELAEFEWPVLCRGKFLGEPKDFCRPDLDSIQNQVADLAVSALKNTAEQKAEELGKAAEAEAGKAIDDTKKEMEKRVDEVRKNIQKKFENQLKNLFGK